eukprot:TRINITY_DN20765_c0_g1_i1.p1 TRINITY_DN20765_c0_g1~~TRINITY_DN20765_c0_g1_i1.p1  ORF type:complete len:242 (+),score=120.59 TRINITY_DN20765_c0_g1_i1:2-727(+)
MLLARPSRLLLPSCRAVFRVMSSSSSSSSLEKPQKQSGAAMDSSGSRKKKKKKINVYTRTGDKGMSSLFNGKRVPKTDGFFHALGATDELNAHLGLAREHCLKTENGLAPYLETIQAHLLDLGSHIATPMQTSSESQVERTKFDDASLVTELEMWIDKLDEDLPPLRNFILPGGGLSSAQLHVARTVARRAERHVVELAEDGNVCPTALHYLNRLSDFLFVSARYAAHQEGVEEHVYKKPK